MSRARTWGVGLVVGLLVGVAWPRAGLEAAAPRESLAVGFGEFAPDESVVDSAHPAAVFLRSAVGGGLISLRRAADGRPASGGFELALADAVKVSADYAVWSLRLRRGAVFQSGRPVSANDVVFSLERCRSRGGLAGVEKALPRRVETSYDAVEEWVDVTVAPAESGGSAAARRIAQTLAECPVWERESALVFGRDFGIGANFVGVGPYRVVAVKPGQQYTLQRVGRAARLETSGVGEITVRSFADPRRGLTALREGTVSVLFTADRGVLEKVAGDDTLVPFECSGFPAVRRRTVVLQCDPGIDVAHFREVR